MLKSKLTSHCGGRRGSGGLCPAAPSRSSRIRARAVAGPQQQQRLMLHVGDTTIGVPFSKDQAQKLDGALQQLLKTFAEKQKAERPKRWEMMEVRFKGEEAGGIDLFEVFCNPNAHATAFEAKLLLTVKAGPVSVATEGRLSAFKADLDQFLSDAL